MNSFNNKNSYVLKSPKTCLPCGKVHTETGVDFKVSLDDLYGGLYWNCSCGSTMFVKFDGVEITPEPKAE